MSAKQTPTGRPETMYENLMEVSGHCFAAIDISKFGTDSGLGSELD
jgi:hypothetical protein